VQLRAGGLRREEPCLLLLRKERAQGRVVLLVWLWVALLARGLRLTWPAVLTLLALLTPHGILDLHNALNHFYEFFKAVVLFSGLVGGCQSGCATACSTAGGVQAVLTRSRPPHTPADSVP
jgi:hypothetical protein